jgi:hypothetical protein
MKIDDPSKLKPGTRLHWHDGEIAEVTHRTWGAVVVKWPDGQRRLYPFDDNIWNFFKIYETEQTTPAHRRKDKGRAQRLQNKAKNKKATHP